ncbi:hypothetical protein [Methanospirillum lacunae]|nr:hypothetical protein [Methanospirillum lacunae]
MKEVLNFHNVEVHHVKETRQKPSDDIQLSQWTNFSIPRNLIDTSPFFIFANGELIKKNCKPPPDADLTLPHTNSE